MAASNLPRGARFADTCNDTAPEPAATRQSFFGGPLRRGKTAYFLKRKTSLSKRQAQNFNPKYYLNHFGTDAKRYWWRGQARKSSDVRVRLYLFLEEPSSRAAVTTSVVTTGFIILMQALHIGSTHLTEEAAAGVAGGAWRIADRHEQLDVALNSGMVVCNAIFSIEFVLRLVALTAPVRIIRTRRDLAGQIAWLTIDAVAIAAFWVQTAIRFIDVSDHAHSVSLESAVRVLDLFGTLRAGRVFHALYRWPDGVLLFHTLYASGTAMIISFVALAVFAFFFGALVYYVELLSLPLDQMAFSDMSMAIWFMFVTFSTVGYGDVSPGSYAGRAVTVIAILCSLTLTAMPISIVGSNFKEAWEERETSQVVVIVQRSMIDQQLAVNDIVGLIASHDHDRSGTLSFLDFVTMMRSLGLEMSQKRARRVFHHFDERGDGEATYAAICRVLFPTWDFESLSKVDVKRCIKRLSYQSDVGPASPREGQSKASHAAARNQRAEGKASAELSSRNVHCKGVESPPGSAYTGGPVGLDWQPAPATSGHSAWPVGLPRITSGHDVEIEHSVHPRVSQGEFTLGGGDEMIMNMLRSIDERLAALETHAYKTNGSMPMHV